MRNGFDLLLSWLIALAIAAPVARAQTDADVGDAVTPSAEEEDGDDWPRVFVNKGTRVVMHQPQVDRWADFKTISARVAMQVTLDGSDEPEYGTLRMTASTVIDFPTRSVLFGRRKIAGAMFSDTDASIYKDVIEAIKKALPSNESLVMSLDEIVPFLEPEMLAAPSVAANLDPPPIIWSDAPAVLVMFIGEPEFKSVQGSDELRFAVNTNWDLFLHTPSSQYYLLDGDGWLSTTDLSAGPWIPAQTLPTAFGALPDDPNWQEVRERIPGTPPSSAPRVFVAEEPTELIVTDGPPQLKPVEGTTLEYVSNTDSDVFRCGEESQLYFLTAGRWFRAPSLDGPWSAATTDLPAEFAKIPEEGDFAYALASVPGTPEAAAAVILASVPRTATINRHEASISVVYDGAPDFAPIEGANAVSYAVNTPESVVQVGDQYYCCHQGVWFVATMPSGPWAVATAVPDDVYTIPSTSPLHNITYVHVESSTADTVEVSQTAGYVGEVVAAGVLLFGLGWAISEADNVSVRVHSGTHFYSYGCSPRYDYYHGGYYRSARAYGPYGGAGRAAAYNPATGTYARGAYRYGPRGGVAAREAYNPYTDRYAGRATASNRYGSWGRSAVVGDNGWARAGSRSSARGTVGAIETSEGGAAIAGRNRFGRTGVVAKDRHGNVYAGGNGRVYRRTDDGAWQQRGGRGWSNFDARSAGRGTNDLQRQARARSIGARRSRAYRQSLRGTGARHFGARGGRGGGRGRRR